MALGGFGQFSGLVGDGLLAGRDPKIQSYPHSFPHSENVRFRYRVNHCAMDTGFVGFLDCSFSDGFCTPSEAGLRRPRCQWQE
jgi:hypothetical protein